MAAKSELGDMQAEHQREMESLLESVRHLSREHKLHQLIMDSFIPLEYQVMSGKANTLSGRSKTYINGQMSHQCVIHLKFLCTLFTDITSS